MTTTHRHGEVKFGARFPSDGRYRRFPQARPDGELITAAFEVSAGE
ncbi:hypothetical protein ACFO0N_03965 [Halobium salinum]|uniref:Uncharacterized protein n=1 Tax=Halobium salinum TaxID=1364940 RepID=A0ABD5P8L8_9EURY